MNRELSELLASGDRLMNPSLHRIVSAEGRRSTLMCWEDLDLSKGTLRLSRGKRTREFKIGRDLLSLSGADERPRRAGAPFDELAASLRVDLARRIEKSLLGPVAGNIRANVIKSLEWGVHAVTVRRHVLEMRTLRKASVARYRYSGSLSNYCRRAKVFEARRLFVLADVIVSPYSGLAWLPEGRVLLESVGSLDRLLWWGRMKHELLLPSRTLRARRPVLACPYSISNYFHWLTETMPALLHGLAHAPDALILVDPRRSPPILFEALKTILGPGWMARVRLAEGPVRVRRLIMPQQQTYDTFIHPKDLAMLTSAFAAFIDRKRNSDLLYVSRGASPQHPFSDEKKLERGLAALGFKIQRNEDLSLREQIRAFSRARVIIAPHGAGLTNLIWAKRPCRVLEIGSSEASGFFNDCYHRISAMKGLRHDYLMCEPQTGTQGRIPVDRVLAWARRSSGRERISP